MHTLFCLSANIEKLSGCKIGVASLGIFLHHINFHNVNSRNIKSNFTIYSISRGDFNACMATKLAKIAKLNLLAIYPLKVSNFFCVRDAYLQQTV